ncbi:hypothetical protein [Nostoc sp.]|uniref:hypothetical protein n=1 Tax=Nostoc sp. TaxID=1180 RepID=UPI002FFB091B
MLVISNNLTGTRARCDESWIFTTFEQFKTSKSGQERSLTLDKVILTDYPNNSGAMSRTGYAYAQKDRFFISQNFDLLH